MWIYVSYCPICQVQLNLSGKATPGMYNNACKLEKHLQGKKHTCQTHLSGIWHLTGPFTDRSSQLCQVPTYLSGIWHPTGTSTLIRYRYAWQQKGFDNTD